jgi:hypothetical protein
MHPDGAGDVGLGGEAEKREPGLERLAELDGHVEPGFRCPAPSDMHQQICHFHLTSPCKLSSMR